MSEADVIDLLGTPFWQRWVYGPGPYVNGCDFLSVENGLVVSRLYSRDCDRDGIHEGMPIVEVIRSKGAATEILWVYSKSPGNRNYWIRVIEFTRNHVTRIQRGLYYD